MISVVIPAFNEAPNLPALRDRLRTVFDGLPAEEFECVIVDDGSRDESARILREIRAEDSRFHWVRLSRNSGSHEAIGCGLKASGGDAVIVLAADLQDPPEVFREFIARWRAGDAVVWAVRTERPGESWINRMASQLYYGVMNLLLASKFPSMGADFFLADRKVVEALQKRYRRHSPNVLFQVASLGFESSTLGYVKRQRHAGKSKWGFKKRLYLFVDSVLAFSPPVLLWLAGAAIVPAAIFGIWAGGSVAGTLILLLGAFYVWRMFLLFSEPPAVGLESSYGEGIARSKMGLTDDR